MESPAVHRVLWIWTASELLALLVGFGLVASSFVGDPPLFAAELATVPPLFRAGLAGFIVLELLIPLWVFFDRRHSRRRSKRGTYWVHVAAMPVLNLFGVVAYLQERPRLRSCSPAETDDHP